MTTKEPIHPELARRLGRASDGNPDVPPLWRGRLGWFVERLQMEGVKVTPETVRKWFAGESRPRHRPMAALAKILKIDEAWLTTGQSPTFSETERKMHVRVAGGVVNAVAGFIQIHGSHPAFPEENDQDAKERQINLYAIIRGAKYNFHVTPAIGTGDDVYFVVPKDARSAIVLGVVPVSAFAIKVYELDWEGISEAAAPKLDGFEVKLKDRAWSEIKSFSVRI